MYDLGTVTQLIVPSNPVTLNTHNGTIETVALATAATGQETFTFNNSNLTTRSTVLLTIEYSGTGFPVASFNTLTGGSLVLVITNVDITSALNNEVTVHFMIIN